MSKSGPTSFGYRRENGRLVFDETEVPILKHMFDLFFEHQRKKTVAEILNAEGLKTRNGSAFLCALVTRRAKTRPKWLGLIVRRRFAL